ncbi:FAD-binding oxidoreductase [Cereibacter changlensis]|uniref:FAD-binding oxidoreductase n=1 Tax=Cereibacter changlensis TaxID=402884 RepID=UPI0040342201
MTLIARLTELLGAANVLTGEAAARYCRDWTGKYQSTPLAVARPGTTAEVSATVRACAEAGVAVVPTGGLTGLTGATMNEGALMLSLERMNRIREIRADTRLAVVEAGTILQSLHEAADAENLYFPLWFGARGSAQIGGVLSTNAGGSNVLRYGSTRALCLGLEVVLADGRVLNLMSELHKDNSGYDLKDLFIGAEGTLGIITAAVMKLVPKPRAHATATLAARSLPDALILLNRLQEATGGAVEAFEYMPRRYMERLARELPGLKPHFAETHDTTILVEVGATAPRDADALADGSLPIVTLLEETLAGMMEEGMVLDATVARTEAQRREMWERRESAARITFTQMPIIDTDIAVPLDRVGDFLSAIDARLAELDPEATSLVVAHLGDGNVHYTAYPSRTDPALNEAVVTALEDVVADLKGSFSAEHGVGLSKLPSMTRRKDPVALDVMRSLKAALDPRGLLNPGKTIPPAGL